MGPISFFSSDVLSLFKKNAEEIAMIWYEPSVLCQKAEKIKLPCWKEYLRIRNDFQSEQWGIFADEKHVRPDFLPELADAYYGDASPEAHRMRILEKPVMLQNAEIQGE